MNNLNQTSSSIAGGRGNAHLPSILTTPPPLRRSSSQVPNPTAVTGNEVERFGDSSSQSSSTRCYDSPEHYEKVKNSLKIISEQSHQVESTRITETATTTTKTSSPPHKKQRTPRRSKENTGRTVLQPASPNLNQPTTESVGLQTDPPTPESESSPTASFLAGWNSKLTQTVSTTVDIVCSICSVGDNKASKDFNDALRDLAMSESTPQPNGRRGRVDVGLFSTLLWALAVLLLPVRHMSTRAIVLVQAIFLLGSGQQADLFDPELSKQSTLHLRKNKFQPWKFLKEMDLHQKINKEMMNRVRKGVEGTPHRGKGLFCHGSWVGQHEKMLEKHAVEAYGLVIEYQDTDIGDIFEFESDNLIRLLLDAFNLARCAKSDRVGIDKPVVMSISADGAKITKEICHFTIGAKFTDARAEDPVTGIPMWLSDDFQSQMNCFPIRMAIAQESKKLVQECMSDLMEKFSRGYKIPADGDKPEPSNFHILFEQDMSHSWKITRKGAGTATGTEYPCYCCEIKLSDMHLHKTKNDRCSLCKKHNVARCFCQPISAQEYISKCEVDLAKHVKEAADEGFAKLDAVKKKSKILHGDKISSRLANKLHIDCRPKTEAQEIAFGQLINQELRLRLRDDRKQLSGIMKMDLMERIKRLKKQLKREEEINKHRHMISRNNKVKNIASAVASEDCFPCILHCENRISEAIFYNLLAHRVQDYNDGGNNSKKRKALVEAVTDMVNTMTLGDPSSGTVGNWRFPSDDAGKTITKKTLTNEQARRCVFGLHSVATLIYSQQYDQDSATPETTRANNEKTRNHWHKLLDHCRMITVMFRQHSYFTSRDLRLLHVHSQLFMRHWVELFHDKCMTNCAHMVGAGHFYFCAERYGNLHRHSQQGWEAMNKRIKAYFHNNTNHGGNRGRGKKSARKHGLDLFRFVQRWTMWRLGLGDAFFNPKMDNVELQVAAEVAATGEEETTQQVDAPVANVGDDGSIVVDFGVVDDDSSSVGSDASQYITF